MSLRAVAITFKEACAYVAALHRHHKQPRGWKFGLGVTGAAGLVGVVIVGRPVARMLDDGATLEITRCCTNGHHNAPSFLYGHASSAAFLLGYRRMVTYTSAEEPGTSLIAAGFTRWGEAGGGEWGRSRRKREGEENTGPKVRWERWAR